MVGCLQFAQLSYLEGLQPFTARFAKPLCAGLGMAVALTSVRPGLSRIALVVAGTGVGLFVFAGLPYLFGVERTDRVLPDRSTSGTDRRPCSGDRTRFERRDRSHNDGDSVSG